MSVNRVILMGKLTRDVELKYLPSGSAATTLGLAINRSFYDKQSQERKEETTYVDIDVFGRQAETASQYLAKGREVVIEGRLKLDQWEDKQSGQKRSKLKVVAENVQFTSGGGAGERSRPTNADVPGEVYDPSPDYGFGPPQEEEVPF